VIALQHKGRLISLRRALKSTFLKVLFFLPRINNHAEKTIEVAYMKPFIHKFNTDGAHYIYDVNLNQIVKVDECIHAIIDHCDTMSREELVDRFRERFPSEEIESSLSHIDDSRTHMNLFSSSRPHKMKYSFTLEEMANELDSRMTQLVLNVTESCNLRCTYCVYSGSYVYERRHTEKRMSSEVARSAVDFFINHSSMSEKRTISFYGGEPLLNFPLIVEIIDYVRSKREKGIEFQVTTNGTLLTPRFTGFMAEHEVSLLISLDGPQDIHDAFRKFPNRKGTFAALTANLERMMEKYPGYFETHVSFGCTIAASSELERIFNYFASSEPYIKRASVVNFMRRFDTTLVMKPPEGERAHDEDLGDMPARFVEMLLTEDASTLASPAFTFLSTLVGKPFQRLHQRSIRPLEKTINPNGICLPGQKRLFVSPEGTFHPCEKMDYHFTIGDVKEGFDYDAIYKLIMDYCALSESDCLNCWALRMCDLCFFAAQENNTLTRERKRERCGEMRKNLHDALTLYAGTREKNPGAFASLAAVAESV
jgi:uncharacterized protein